MDDHSVLTQRRLAIASGVIFFASIPIFFTIPGIGLLIGVPALVVMLLALQSLRQWRW